MVARKDGMENVIGDSRAPQMVFHRIILSAAFLKWLSVHDGVLIPRNLSNPLSDSD